MTISMPLLWVVFPLIIATIAGIFYQKRIFGIILCSAVSIGLAILAGIFPEDLALSIGPVSILFEESLGILGRQISTSQEFLPFITFLYAMTGLWTLSSGLPGTPLSFRPSSLIITALLTAALGVEPFLYAALLIQTAVLASIPMLSPIGEKTHPSILRYLSLQTLAMPFILLAGWLLTGVETLPTDSPLVGQTMLVLGLGFALWLSIFPFHSWVPMVSERSQSTVVSYLLFIIPTTILVFSLKFLQRYAFLRTSEEIFTILQWIGTLMILVGGLWTAIQDNLKRAFGFSALTETGFSLLAIGLSAEGGLQWLLLLFPARGLGFWLWGHTLAIVENHLPDSNMKTIQGLARRFPILSAGLLLAQFSIAGLPLLASFPIKITLLTTAFDAGTGVGIWSFMGNLGLFIFSVRLLLNLVSPTDPRNHPDWSFSEKAFEYLPVLIMILALITLGLFPHRFPAGIVNTLTVFTQLQ